MCRSNRIRHGLLALIAIASLACLASCGSGEGRSSRTPAGAPATTAAQGDDLFADLPTASDIGNGYRIQQSSRTDPPEPFDPSTTTTTTANRFNVFDKFCPGARWPRLGARPDVDGVEYVKFVGEDDREVSVGLAPVSSSLDQDGMNQLKDAINSCGTFTNERGGIVDTNTVRADAVEDVGDYGIDIHWTSDTSVKGQQDLPMDLATSTRTYLVVVDDVLVAVEGDGGFDLDEMATVSGDEDLVPVVAQATVKRLEG